MRLLLDQGLPRSTVDHLAKLGIDAEHVGELGLAKAVDDTILDEARNLQAVAVTFDADFHRILALSGAVTPSAIRIRIEGMNGDQLSALLSHVIGQTRSELESGALVTVTETRVRVRKLPIR